MTALHDHPDMTLGQKEAVLADWVRFVASGFSLSAFTDRLFDFLFLGFWVRNLPDDDEGHRHEDVEGKSKVAFWNRYFNRDLDTLKETLQALMGIGQNLGRQDGLSAHEATADLDLRIAQALAEHDDRFSRILDDYSRLVRDRLLEAQIEQALAVSPTLKRADLVPHNYSLIIPPEAMAVTDELRARLSEAVNAPARRLTHPALFARRPNAPLLPASSNQGEGDHAQGEASPPAETQNKGMAITQRNPTTSATRKMDDPNSV